MNFALKKLGLIAVLSLSACAHSIHQVNVSDFEPYAPIESGNMVSANSEQFVVMSWTGNTDYVNDAYQKLLASCDGTVSGISTQFSTSLGFFSWTNKILMQGLCLPSTKRFSEAEEGQYQPARKKPRKKKAGSSTQ